MDNLTSPTGNPDSPAAVTSTATESPSSPEAAGSPRPASSRWQRVRFVLRAIEIRLRFVALFVAIGLIMAYWRTIENHWDRWTRPTRVAATLEADTEFYCVHHLQVVRTELNPDGSVPTCPLCGMPLSKRKKGAPVTLPAGITARIQLSPERIQLAGIETAIARYQPLVKDVRTVGYISYDESRLSRIVTRVSGYLERLYVDQTFDVVKEGQPLAEIYSPELYSSVQELRLAQKYNSPDLVGSARKRLELFGIDEAEIEETLRAENPRARLLVRSPQSGHVIQKNVVTGAAVTAGETLFEVADLSTVWIEAEIYERDLGFVQVGDTVNVRVEAFPGRVFSGQVSLIYPQLNTATRTGQIRITLDNPQGQLRPGMYATAHIQTPLSEMEPYRTRLASRRSQDESSASEPTTCPVTGLKLGAMGPPITVHIADQSVQLCCNQCTDEVHADPEQFLVRLAAPPEDAVLTIPASAIVDTGTRRIVYIERDPGVFEGVEVELGARVGDAYPVLEGLSPGDRVAAAGAFLLDAETRLRPAAGSTYFGASGNGPSAGDRATTGASSGHQH